MERRCKSVFSKIRQAEQCRKSYAAHTAHKRPFLRFKTIRPNSFVTHKVQCFVFVGIVCFLKDSDIICAALVKIFIILAVDGVNLKTDHFEIFSRQLARLTDIFNIAFCLAFARENEYFLHSRIGDNFHFMLNLLV